MIDKELAQSGEMTSGIVDSRLEVAIRQTRKMDACMDRKLIMINPIEELDATGEEAWPAVGSHAETALLDGVIPALS